MGPAGRDQSLEDGQELVGAPGSRGHLGRLPPCDKKGTDSRRAQGDNLRLPGWRANSDPH